VSELEPRDHQLLADLERAFPHKSFLLMEGKWTDFEARGTLATLPGDETSIDRLVKAGKVTDLGSMNGSRHFVIREGK
jgi:hypothetical protein